MKNMLKILFILILLIIYIYVCNIVLLPNNIVLFQEEELKFGLALGLKIEQGVNRKNQTMQAVSSINEKLDSMQKVNYNLTLFGKKVREVSVNVIPQTKVIPVGIAAGLKLYTNGVLVIGMSEIETKNNGKEKPYKDSGIKEGDTIISVNEKNISTTDELISAVNSASGEAVKIEFISENTQKVTSIKPAKAEDGEYKLGLWVRDAAAGVGTVTFYEPSTGKFAALGHGITDIDTEQLITIANGELVTTNIVSTVKGEKGKPGEMKGSIDNSNKIGNVTQNTYLGIYGNVTNKNYLNLSEQAIDVALRSEIKTGKAQIICQLENEKQEKYDIEIEKIYVGNNTNNKSMMIKITDDKLIEKTRWNNTRNVWLTYNTKW